MAKIAKLVRLAATFALLTAGSAHAATELIINGSFENLGFGRTLPSRQSGTFNIIDGWVSLTHGIEIQNNVLGAAADGNNAVELDTSQNSSMSQLILGTRKNQSYVLSFDLQDRAGVAGSSQGIEVLWNGAVVGTYGAGYSAWTVETLIVTGSRLGADLLTFKAIGTSDSLGTALDNVSLISGVPEPETYGMLLAGLGMIGVMARRRKPAK